MDTIKAFLNKAKIYYILLTTLALAILYALFLKRGQKLNDLQRQIIVQKLNEQLKDATQKAQETQNVYDKSLQNYHNLADAYRKLSNKPPVK